MKTECRDLSRVMGSSEYNVREGKILTPIEKEMLCIPPKDSGKSSAQS